MCVGHGTLNDTSVGRNVKLARLRNDRGALGLCMRQTATADKRQSQQLNPHKRCEKRLLPVLFLFFVVIVVIILVEIVFVVFVLVFVVGVRL